MGGCGEGSVREVCVRWERVNKGVCEAGET